MIFLRHHLHESLKTEYLTVKDQYVLWKNLKERYDHQKTVILPQARYEWIHLRLQDFRTVGEYNSAMFRITSQLKLCGENITDADMLEKSFSTFHASNLVLQQQYRERGFQRYSELISCLLVAEQNNELLMKNHQSRPTGSVAFPEVNATSTENEPLAFPEANATSLNNRGRNRGRGRKHGRGWNTWHRSGQNTNSSRFKKSAPYHQKWENSEEKGKGFQKKPSKSKENICYRCGMKGHWVRTCRTPKHLADLYQASLKEKEKGVETNFVNHNDQIDTTLLDISDFLENPEESYKNIFDN